MNNTTCSSKTHYPAVWISDVHLGYKDCQAQYLLDFLNAIECDVLYLVGDIVDLWSMKRQFFWHPSHYDVLALIQQKAKDGTRVIYIPGNHDETFRHYANDSVSKYISNISIPQKLINGFYFYMATILTLQRVTIN